MTHPMLTSFAYCSRASAELTREGLVRLIAQITHINRERDIRGLLFHRSGHFKQIIEGPQRVMIDVVAAILADPRHELIEVLGFRTCQQHSFSRWHYVGFEDVDLPAELQPPPPTPFELRFEDALTSRSLVN